MDFTELMRMAAQVRAQVAHAESEAADTRVTGEAGAGLVRVVMNGKHEVIELRIDPKTLVASEVGLLEDLVRAAVNQASAKVAEALRDRVAGIAQKLGLDPSVLGGLPGL